MTPLLWVAVAVVASADWDKKTSAAMATTFTLIALAVPVNSEAGVLGKTEPHIAHETQIHGIVPGHNKFDFPYIYDVRKPEVTLTALSCGEVDRIVTMPPEAQCARLDDVRTHQFLYQAPTTQLGDPTFVALYLPHRVALEEGIVPVDHPVGCWYVREGAAVPFALQLARE